MITKSLTIFFPAYNEQDNIIPSVKEALKVASDITSDYEVIVVNDGSIDATGKLLDELANKNHHVIPIHHQQNKGYGGAVWTGIKSATKDLIFFTDIDRQFDIHELKKFIEHIDHYDAVIGYRNPRNDPKMRLFNAWGWKMLIRRKFGLRVKDIDCAFKLFRREIFDDIKVNSRGAMVSAEILIKIDASNYKIKELPVSHYPRKAGSPTGAKPSVIIKAFKELKSFQKDFKK